MQSFTAAAGNSAGPARLLLFDDWHAIEMPCVVEYLYCLRERTSSRLIAAFLQVAGGEGVPSD